MNRPCPPRGATGAPLAALLAALLLPALTACGPASRDAVLACTVAADCGPGARCAAGACQASTPPAPAFTLPAGLTTNRRVSVTATATDPDPGDAVSAWAWTVTRLAAACDADLDAADGPTLQAVFWCPGTYEVAVVATDSAGAASAPVRRTVSIAALDGAPSVTAGAAAAVDHRCAGSPLRCELAAPVALTADARAPLGGPLTYRWTALPPDAARAAAEVALSPSASAAAPSLSLSTAGGAISGTWRLRVRVEDALGNLAQAIQVVVVGNRPPVVDGAALSLDHRYEGGAYLVDGPLAVAVSDPDGDPVEVSYALREPAGSGCGAGFTASAPGAGGGVRLSLSCPTPAGLMASGRLLEASAADPNGGAASAAASIEVRNRLPVVRPAAGAGVTELTLDHGVTTCPGGAGACFVAEGPSPFVVVDPDGDPVTAVTLVPAVDASRVHSAAEAVSGPGGATFRFTTPVAYPTEFRAPSGASGFTLTATASDPFGASAPAQPALAIRIGNRPPLARLAPGVPPSVPHRFDAATSTYLAGAPVAVFEDPDGDPLDASPSAGDDPCGTFSMVSGVVSVACLRPYLVGPATYPTLAGFAGDHALLPAASDGWATASIPVTFHVANSTPWVESYVGAVEACSCQCPVWDVDLPGVCATDPILVKDPKRIVFPLQPGDDEGDPLHVTYAIPGAPAGSTITPTARTGLPGSLAAAISATGFPLIVQITVNDGVSAASGDWKIDDVICARAGQICANPLPARR